MKTTVKTSATISTEASIAETNAMVTKLKNVIKVEDKIEDAMRQIDLLLKEVPTTNPGIHLFGCIRVELKDTLRKFKRFTDVYVRN